MDYRKAIYNQFGSIDLEINHPVYGWIPFTASPDDPEQYGRDIFNEIDKNAVGPYVPPPPAPSPVPDLISDRQFFQALAVQGVITQEEALAAVKTGDIPSGMVPLVAGLPEESRFAAEMLLSGATELKRSHPLTSAFGSAFGWTGSQIDEFWIAASAL